MDSNINKPKVKAHGSFILREGWMNKALTELSKEGNEKIFSSPEATDIFGIGTNMVPALKYWISCFNLIIDKGNKGVNLSPLGNLIFENDSYLEDIFTIWILHSNLVKNYEKASLIHDYFQDEKIQIISKETLTSIFMKKWKQFGLPENSIKSDVDILFNMYCKSKINDDPEDKIVSPLNELNLISYDGENYVKIQPDLRLLPDEVILYELSCIFEREYASVSHNDKIRRSLSIDRVVNGEYGLSKIYNLSNVSANQLLNRLQTMKYITIDRTAGLDVIYAEKIPTPLEVVENYYKQK